MNERVPSLIVISAPSGAGKSTILARVLEALPSLRYSVSHTTRSPRTGEEDGVHYHFVDRAAFEALIRQDAFLEWAEVHGGLYGTSRREYERAVAEGRDLILDIDVQGARQVRERRPGTVSIFIMPPSFAELERRLRSRGLDEARVLERRLATARTELRAYEEYDYLVVNDALDESVAAVTAIIQAVRCRREVMRTCARRVLESLSG